jgi:DnaJ-class molecular chaperone
MDFSNLFQSLYSILDASPDSSPFQIRQHYKSLSLLYHPDRNSAPEAEGAFNAIRVAYEVWYHICYVIFIYY